MVRKAFKLAQTERPGAVYLAVPEDVEKAPAPAGPGPLPVNVPRPDEPSPARSSGPRRCCARRAHPIVLAGHGAARAGAGPALRRFAESLGIPVATTFHGKGVFPDDHPLALGAVGFMRHDYVNFGFDQRRRDHRRRLRAAGVRPGADQPARRQQDHPHPPLPGRGGRALRRRGRAAVRHRPQPRRAGRRGRTARRIRRRRAETASVPCWRPSWTAAGPTTGSRWRRPGSSPTPARRCGRDDIVLVDTGALKMWMARLYPTYEPNTCLISNGLSTMAWTVPGAIGAKIARPECRVLVATGDGAFLMNSQEIETALRLRPAVRDPDLGGRRLRADQLEDGPGDRPQRGHHVQQPGLRRLRRELRRDRLPDRGRRRAAARRCAQALAADTVSVIACPVDYSANLELIDSLGELDESLS